MTSEENEDAGLRVNNENILNHSLDKEMKTSYINYAMSVIIGEAADVRDGLKPVHRRVLYGMKEGIPLRRNTVSLRVQSVRSWVNITHMAINQSMTRWLGWHKSSH